MPRFIRECCGINTRGRKQKRRERCLLLLFICSVVSDSLWFHGLQHTRLPCPSPSPRVCLNSCPSSQWCHPTTSSSDIPFSSCLQSFPESGSFQWVISSHQVAKVLEFQLQHQSFQWIFRTDFLQDGLVGSPCNSRDSQESSTSQFESINSSALNLLYGPTLTSMCDYWKNHGFNYMDLCQQSDIPVFYWRRL